MKVLLSIKPEFAEKIFSGDKCFEYRKAAFRRAGVRTVVVYVTRPVAMIVGEFDVEEIISGSPDDVWFKTKEKAGITREFYDSYFARRNSAYALRIGRTCPYEQPVSPTEMFENFVAPQSYMYVPNVGEATERQLGLDWATA